MARDDRELVRKLLKSDKRWRTAFDTLEADYRAELLTVFGPLVSGKREIVLAHLSRLELSEHGIILNNTANERIVRELVEKLTRLHKTTYGPHGDMARKTGPAMNKAARMGVRHALDAIRVGEPGAMPGKAYRGADSMRLVAGAEGLLLDGLRTGAVRDIDSIRTMFLRRMLDTEGTTDALRQDIAASGQIDGMLDSIGRRITVDERADRIARYELGKLSQESHEAAVGEVYFDGSYDPKQVWYLWIAVRDDRVDEIHLARDGHVMTAEEWDTHDWGDDQYGGPPLRPRCRCSRTFVMPHWFSKETRSSVFHRDGGGSQLREVVAA